MTLLAISMAVLAAVAVFLFMQFRRADEQLAASQKIATLAGDLDSTKKKLAGFTKALDQTAPVKKALVEQAPSLVFKISRDYLHTENVAKERFKLKADVKAYVQYTAEYTVGVDTKAGRVEVVSEPMDIHLKVNTPAQLSNPVVRNVVAHFCPLDVVADERPILQDITQKLNTQAQRLGPNIAREDAVRALCRSRLVEIARETLAHQSGVQHLPFVSVDFT